MKQNFTVRQSTLDRVEAFFPGLLVLCGKPERNAVEVLRLQMAPSSKERREAASSCALLALVLRTFG
jgi:hypothetical protein